MSDVFPELREEPGWFGAFTRATAPGAIPGGTRIAKCDSEDGDSTPDDTPGVVLGSISHPEVENGALLYFVEWSNRPGLAVACMGFKVRRMDS